MQNDGWRLFLFPARQSVIMFSPSHGRSRHSLSQSHSPLLTIMELEALIKHLLSELRNRETVILDNIDSLKVNIVFDYSRYGRSHQFTISIRVRNCLLSSNGLHITTNTTGISPSYERVSLSVHQNDSLSHILELT